MQSAPPGEDAGVSADELDDLLGLDLSEPLGPGLFEGIGPNANMDGGEDYPEWTAADLLFEPYAMNLLYPLEDASSNVNPLTPTVQGNAGNSGNSNSGKEGNTGSQTTLSALKAKVPRWKRRTKEQSEANKRAQKLYRERKKARMKMLEAEQEALHKRVTDLEKLAAVEAENKRLVEELQATKADLDEARRVAAIASTQGSLRPGILGRLLPGRSHDDGLVEGPETSAHGPYPKRDLAEVHSKWLNQVNELWRFLQEGKIAPSDKTFSIDQATLESIDGHMKLVLSLCMQVLNLGGVDLERLMAASVHAVGGPEKAQATDAKYLSIVNSLNLTVDQRRKAAKFYQHCKPVLEKIYEERRGLNMEAIRLLAENPAACSLQHAKTNDVLGRLLENLRREQCALSEQNYLVYRMLLSATQGAWLVVRCFPHHCDCMAVFRAIEAIGPLPKDYGGWLDI